MTSDLFEVSAPPVSGERIRQARELLQMTQSDLAVAVGVDQTMIAHIERGTKQPNSELLQALATTLQLPTRFFRLPAPPALPKGSLLFRAKAGVGRRVIARTHAHAELVFEMAYRLSNYAKSIAVTVPRGLDPIESARETRTLMGYSPTEPAMNLVRAIERLGVLVIALPPSDECDAFAVWSRTDQETPIIGLASGKAFDRARMNAAHELGHLVLHGNIDAGTPALEREAYQFAAELLMPAQAIAVDLNAERPSLFTLARLKAKWQVSMQALARRAKDLSILSDRQFRYLMQQISSRGWRTIEPEFTALKPEVPRGLRKMIEIAFGGDVTPATVARRFDLSEDFATALFNAYAPPPMTSKSKGSNTKPTATVVSIK